MSQSESIKEISAALVKAQQEMGVLAKDANGQVGSQRVRYASLEAVVDVVGPAFHNNGLAYTQFPIRAGAGMVGLKTKLIHISGEWMEEEFELPAQATAQGYGSGLTYARRYALQAVAGIAPEDDDGAAAMPAKKPAGRESQARPTQARSAGYVAEQADPETGEIAEPAVPQKVWASFWLKTKELQFTDQQVHDFAKKQSLAGSTRAELGDILEGLKEKRAKEGPPKPIEVWKPLPEPTAADYSPNADLRREPAGAR